MVAPGCAQVNCKNLKNVSGTLQTRCCGKKVIGITPAAAPKSKCAGLTGATLEKCKNSGKSIVQRVAEGEKPEKRPPSIFDKVLDPSKQTKEEKESKTSTPIILGGKPADSPEGSVDEDCDSWGWLKFMCVGGKSATKGYNDCMGTGIPCGYLVIGGLAVVLLFMVLK